MSLNMDEHIMIRNLCEWSVFFKRINGIGDIAIPPKTVFRIDRGEVYAQVQSGNILFKGNDEKGSHARIFIEDKETRIDIGFETEKEKQKIITEEKVKSVFAVKFISVFEKEIEGIAQSYAEKATLVKLIKKLHLNEYDKIKFIENYTGINII